MTTNMTTMNSLTSYPTCNELDWASLILANNESAGQASPANGTYYKTASEIEQADLEAARQLGQMRKQETNRLAQTTAKNGNLAGAARTWLQEEPYNWRGRQVRHRSSGQIFTIRQVFKSGRVELKKSFMLYLSNIAAVRADYLAA